MLFRTLSLMSFTIAGLAMASGLESQELRIPAGSLVESRAGSSLVASTESFEVPAPVVAAMSNSVEPLVVLDFPVAPGRREAVRWQRVEIWAEGAKIHWNGEAGPQAMDPPRGKFFRGVGMQSGARLAVRVEDGKLVGIAYTDDSLYDLLPFSETDRGLQSIALSLSMSTEDVEQSCANEDAVVNDAVFREARSHVEPLLRPGSPTGLNGGDAAAAATSLASIRGGVDKQMVIGVETDNSLWNKKGASFSSVNNYIADLFQAMNVFYERDLGTRLVIGDTFHWPTANGADPYTNSSGASSSLLAEVRNYWNANRTSVDRVFAMLLSGNSSSPFSSSGIATLSSNTYCGSSGYSMTQVFTYSSGAGAADAMVVGHEIGHNAGSPHTHCYSPVVDQCSNIGGGCWGGGLSCPPGGKGTLMSYCHFSSGSNCGSNKLEFHPTVIGQLSSLIEDAYPTCVEPLAGLFDIFNDGFESGNTSRWQ